MRIIKNNTGKSASVRRETENHKRFCLCLALMAIAAAGCTSESVHNNNTCECKKGFVCLNNECTPLYDNVCDPECEEGKQICINNKCEDIKDDCSPACDDVTQVCANKTCHYKDPWCEPGTCTDDKTQRCVQVEGRNAGQYEECKSGTGCFRGECIEGVLNECSAGECNADGTAECINGSWKACGSYQKCTDGACLIDITMPCETDSCLPGYSEYYCADGAIKKCDDNYICEDGRCIESTTPQIENSDLLWTLCEVKSDCSYGICLKSLPLSTPYYEAGKDTPMLEIPVQMLDSRIPEGFGICSTDCTLSPDACIDNSGKTWGTCQLVYFAESPYINKDAEGKPLDFPLSLDPERLANAAPYSAICRPNILENDKTYKTSFCQACTIDSDCNGGKTCSDDDCYKCADNICVPQCKNVSACPATFTCDIEDGETKGVCLPPSGICDDCIDLDRDHYGIGNCTYKGVDCNDDDNASYYLSDKTTCALGQDMNCNGFDDGIEMLGTADNCSVCGDTCKLENNNNKMTKECVNIDSAGNETGKLRDTLDPFAPETWMFACKTTCEVGYADCDGDPKNGCETKLFDVVETSVDEKELVSIELKDKSSLFSRDADADSYGDAKDQI